MKHINEQRSGELCKQLAPRGRQFAVETVTVHSFEELLLVSSDIRMPSTSTTYLSLIANITTTPTTMAYFDRIVHHFPDRAFASL